MCERRCDILFVRGKEFIFILVSLPHGSELEVAVTCELLGPFNLSHGDTENSKTMTQNKKREKVKSAYEHIREVISQMESKKWRRGLSLSLLDLAT